MSALFPEHVGPDRQVEGSERDQLDAYWTPIGCARACCQALRRDRVFPGTVLEPAAGGGAWVRAARETWPTVHVDAVDIDPEAPGLRLADAHVVGDFMQQPGRGYGLVIGNPPYGGDLAAWIDQSLDVGHHVAYLLRSTFLGSHSRADWWRNNPPAVVWMLVGRPKWEGPGARSATDTTDSVLVLWSPGRPTHDTALRWLRWSP